MKNRKNREVGRNPLRGLSSYNILDSLQVLLPHLQNISLRYWNQHYEPFEKWMRWKKAYHLQKKKKENKPQTKLLSGGRWKAWWFRNEPHFTISTACLGEVFQLPSCSRTFHVAAICVLIHVLVRYTPNVKAGKWFFWSCLSFCQLPTLRNHQSHYSPQEKSWKNNAQTDLKPHSLN